jgi:hypothetical protein
LDVSLKLAWYVVHALTFDNSHSPLKWEANRRQWSEGQILEKRNLAQETWWHIRLQTKKQIVEPLMASMAITKDHFDAGTTVKDHACPHQSLPLPAHRGCILHCVLKVWILGGLAQDREGSEVENH